jgi:hypothetical protein
MVRTSTTVDDEDLDAMILAYSKKIKSSPTKYLDGYLSTILSYVLPNTERGGFDFPVQLSRVTRHETFALRFCLLALAQIMYLKP